MTNRRAITTLAIIVLVCFFLPWIQVSCGATKETASGIDLARDGNAGLWLIPLLTLVVLFLGLKPLKERYGLSALISLVSGLVSSYLMNRERMKFEDGSGFISVGVTGWFWLGLGSSIAIVILSAIQILRLQKSTSSEDSA